MNLKIKFQHTSLALISCILVNLLKMLHAEEYVSIEQLWIEFKLKNGKAYGSLEEEYNRLVIQKENSRIYSKYS